MASSKWIMSTKGDRILYSLIASISQSADKVFVKDANGNFLTVIQTASPEKEMQNLNAQIDAIENGETMPAKKTA